MKLRSLWLVAFFIPWSALAFDGQQLTTENKVSSSTIRNLPSPIKIETIISQQDEPLIHFLKRAGQSIESLTVHYDFEFCSRIWQNIKTNQYELHVYTIQSHVGCLIPQEIENQDWNPSSLTIHSHPVIPIARANAIDVLLNQGKYNVGDKIQIESNHFSPIDRLAGAGYLIANGNLLYQDSTTYEVNFGSIYKTSQQ